MMALAALAAPAFAEDERPVTATVGGRLHLDFATFDNDNRGTPNKDDTEIRRAWVDVSGKFFVVDYKLEADFSGDRVEAKDVYLSRSFGDAGRLTVGQFKQYFSLDDRTGSNYGSFLERGNAGTTLAPLYRLGASWQANPGDFTWAASVYSLESIDAWQVKGRAAGGRVTWAPAPSDGDVLHLGLSLAREAYDNPGGNGTPGLKIRPRPAGHLSDESRLTLVDFSAGRDTDVNKWSLEYAQVRGPLSWQGEFSGATFDDGAQRGDVMAAYGMLSWFVTVRAAPTTARPAASPGSRTSVTRPVPSKWPCATTRCGAHSTLMANPTCAVAAPKAGRWAATGTCATTCASCST